MSFHLVGVCSLEFESKACSAPKTGVYSRTNDRFVDFRLRSTTAVIEPKSEMNASELAEYQSPGEVKLSDYKDRH